MNPKKRPAKHKERQAPYNKEFTEQLPDIPIEELTTVDDIAKLAAKYPLVQ